MLLIERFWFVFLGLLLGCCISSHANAQRLLVTGDILLSRMVSQEIQLRHGQSPWAHILLPSADWVVGNLEGSVGTTTDCLSSEHRLCFATQASYLDFLNTAGFKMLGIENNHSADLGVHGKIKTRESLQQRGLSFIDFDYSPTFLKLGQHTIAWIAVNTVAGADKQKTDVPSLLLSQKIRLARALADFVVIYIHWGEELVDWPHKQQYEMARWLINQGVDVILGHHPHVVQEATCLNQRPVFFSLGNHVFDQKYPPTKDGLMADCQIKEGQLSCAAWHTHTRASSSFPYKIDFDTTISSNLKSCTVKAHAPLHIDDHVLSLELEDKQLAQERLILQAQKKEDTTKLPVKIRLSHVLSVFSARLDQDKNKPAFLLTLERHFSSLDHKESPRPYVYRFTDHGLVAAWRGSALAWPLIDIQLISVSGVDYLCALHQQDSFLVSGVSSATRTAVYQWNGFGFSGVDGSESLSTQCRLLFARLSKTLSLGK